MATTASTARAAFGVSGTDSPITASASRSVGSDSANDIGDGMECVDGTWQCVVHPPLGEGCNLVCTTADQCTEIGCNDGVTVELAAQPIYAVDAPNGPGCGPACAFGSIEVAAL